MPSPPSKPHEVRRWLEQRPALPELRDAFPEHWEVVQREVSALAARGDLEELKARVLAVSSSPTPVSRRERRAHGEEALVAAEIRRHMTVAALKQLCLSVATGRTEGRVRFNLVNGYVAQKLLFESDLRRKPVSLRRFRLLWPLLWQRKLLMPLVGPKGIYCFYSRKLIRELADLIGDRTCLEIAAGDGTLSRFLADAGVDVVATDDRSWSHTITFPEEVVDQDAREALRTHRPQVVLCSWPPAGNPFEREVFATPGVELYIVIASRHRFASGNWADYESQAGFDFEESARLSAYVLPPEVEGAVFLFTARVAA